MQQRHWPKPISLKKNYKKFLIFLIIFYFDINFWYFPKEILDSQNFKIKL